MEHNSYTTVDDMVALYLTNNHHLMSLWRAESALLLRMLPFFSMQ